MTAQEAHIELDLGLQRINSFDSSEILPQEKDWFINNEVLKFIKQRTNPKSNVKGDGFEDTIKRLEDIKDLVQTRSLSVLYLNNRLGQVILPDDFHDYVSSESTLLDMCDSPKLLSSQQHKFVFSIRPKANLTSSTSVYSVTLGLESNNGNVNYIFNSGELPNNYITSSNYTKQSFLMINAIMIKGKEELKKMSPSFHLYRENYKEEFHNDSFILITSTNVKSVKVMINGTEYIVSPTVVTNRTSTIPSSTLAISDDVDTIPKRDIKSEPLVVKNRVIEHEYLGDIVNSALSKSTSKSVVSSHRKGVIELNFPIGYVISKVNLTYICKPSKMDILLNRNLDFETNVCKEIIDNTVRYLKAVLSDSNYQAYIQENSLIE